MVTLDASERQEFHGRTLEEVLAWYREKAEGAGRIRIADIILREGADSLLDHLRTRFPEYVLDETMPPQLVNTQTGKWRSLQQ